MTSDKMELYPLPLPEELLYLPYEFSFLHCTAGSSHLKMNRIPGFFPDPSIFKMIKMSCFLFHICMKSAKFW